MIDSFECFPPNRLPPVLVYVVCPFIECYFIFLLIHLILGLMVKLYDYVVLSLLFAFY